MTPIHVRAPASRKSSKITDSWLPKKMIVQAAARGERRPRMRWGTGFRPCRCRTGPPAAPDRFHPGLAQSAAQFTEPGEVAPECGDRRDHGEEARGGEQDGQQHGHRLGSGCAPATQPLCCVPPCGKPVQTWRTIVPITTVSRVKLPNYREIDENAGIFGRRGRTERSLRRIGAGFSWLPGLRAPLPRVRWPFRASGAPREIHMGSAHIPVPQRA